MVVEWLAAGSMLAGGASSFLSSKAAKKTARRAEAEARRQREWYTAKAKETQRRLGREIDTMRTLRDLGMAPRHKQAAEIALIQQRRGMELQQRRRQIGGLSEDYRQQLFGGQTQQYFQRQAQDLEHYTGMSQRIFDAASSAQAQVNQLLAAGGQVYSQSMDRALQMRYQAGDPWAGILGATAQGLSMAASGMQSQYNQERAAFLKSGESYSEWSERSKEFKAGWS
jgi:hypothetical protein